MHQLIKAILLNGDSRDRALQYMATVISSNAKKAHMHVSLPLFLRLQSAKRTLL